MLWRKGRRRKTDPEQVSRLSRPSELVTTDLRLSPLGEEDAASLQALWSAPEVCRYLWDGHALDIQMTRDILMRSRLIFEERGQGLWGAYDGEGQLLGFCGFWHFHGESELELMLATRAGHWLKNIGSQMVGSMIDYGFDHLQLSHIRASVHRENRACMHLLRKFGFAEESARIKSSAKQFLCLSQASRSVDGYSWEAA